MSTFNLAKLIYFTAFALRVFMSRYRNTDRAYRCMDRAARCLDQLRLELDSVFCGQFSDNPRPADPDYMDSPYISGAIYKKMEAKFIDEQRRR